MIQKRFDELKVGELITHPGWGGDIYLIEDSYHVNDKMFLSLNKISNGWKCTDYYISKKDFVFDVYQSMKHYKAAIL